MRGVDTGGVDTEGLFPENTDACFDIQETEVQEFRHPNLNQVFEADTLSSFLMAVTDVEDCVPP
jgi:hypothetical protein